MPKTSFRRHLLLVFTGGALLLVILGGYGIRSYYQLLTQLNNEQLYADEILLRTKQIANHYSQQNFAWANILLRGNDSEKYHTHLSDFYEHERQTLQQAEVLAQQVAGNDQLYALTQRFLKSLQQLRKKYREALRLYNSAGDSQRATEKFLSAVTQEPTAILNDIEHNTQQYHSAVERTLRQRAQQDELSFVLLLIGLVIVLVITLIWFIDVSFARPISLAIQTAHQVAKGNLNERIQIKQHSEFGVFADAFNLMLDKLAISQTKLESTVAELQDEIRQRERVEQALRKEQHALGEAVSELESFSYSVSHDLRAPLRAISGFATMLQEDYSERLGDEGKDHLARISKGAARMGCLIDELLELSRVNRTNLTLERVDLSALAQEAVAELQTDEPQRHVDVEITPGLTSSGDLQLLRSVLANLLGNAWKYSRNSHHPRIEFGMIHDAEIPVYYIRDNGIGFDMKFSEKLFRPFQRLHSNEEFEGTGIGLATVNRIIRRHGGRIWAEAAPGKGATFRFTLGNEGDTLRTAQRI